MGNIFQGGRLGSNLFEPNQAGRLGSNQGWLGNIFQAGRFDSNPLGQVKKKYVSRPDVGQKAGKRGIFFFLLSQVRSFQVVRREKHAIKREF